MTARPEIIVAGTVYRLVRVDSESSHVSRALVPPPALFPALTTHYQVYVVTPMLVSNAAIIADVTSVIRTV
jgi:hypothetical protein